MHFGHGAVLYRHDQCLQGRHGAMDADRFLEACATGSVTGVIAQVADIEAAAGQDTLLQGLVMARMSGHQPVVEFARPMSAPPLKSQ